MAQTKAIITVVLDPRVAAAIEAAARDAQRSRNNFINTILERWYAEQPEQQKDSEK